MKIVSKEGIVLSIGIKTPEFEVLEKSIQKGFKDAVDKYKNLHIKGEN